MLSFTSLQPTPSYAHHNQFQGFDPDKQQIVTGTVERFAWQTPPPRIMIAADTKAIELDGDAVRIRAEYDLTDRIAYLDARPPQGRTLHGHSLARWQDGALIVETSNFTENASGVTNGLPSSTEKHLVERFALAADGQSLLDSFELTDPVYLADRQRSANGTMLPLAGRRSALEGGNRLVKTTM